MLLTARDISVRFGEFEALSGVSLDLGENQWLMLAGPNGSGKSTLLRAIAGAVPHAGTVTLMGRDARAMNASQLARLVGVMAQTHPAGFGYTAREVVSLGRYAHRRSIFSAGDVDGAARVEEALARVGLTHLADQRITALSGGELQRVFLAQVLAQNPSVLLLDEPANHLDPAHQRQTFRLIDEWRMQPGRAVISVVHDLSLARRFGTHAMLLHRGRCIARGESSDTLTRENLMRAYDMDVAAWMRELMETWAT